jgi:hypothetical protein
VCTPDRVPIIDHAARASVRGTQRGVAVIDGQRASVARLVRGRTPRECAPSVTAGRSAFPVTPGRLLNVPTTSPVAGAVTGREYALNAERGRADAATAEGNLRKRVRDLPVEVERLKIFVDRHGAEHAQHRAPGAFFEVTAQGDHLR